MSLSIQNRNAYHIPYGGCHVLGSVTTHTHHHTATIFFGGKIRFGPHILNVPGLSRQGGATDNSLWISDSAKAGTSGYFLVSRKDYEPDSMARKLRAWLLAESGIN